MQKNIIKTIAVWNTAYLGDTVLTLPLIQTLAKNYPNAHIDFYVRKGFHDFYINNPHIHSVIEYHKQKLSINPTIHLIRYIREQKYDLWINTHPSIRSSIITACSKAKIRIGYTENIIQPLCCTHLVKRKMGTLDEIERLLDLLTCLDIPHASFQSWPQIFIPTEIEKKIDTFWNTHIFGPTLGINPGSVWATKRWPPEGFATIAKKAIENGAHVIILGGPGEEHLVNEIIKEANIDGHPLVHNLSKNLSLLQLAAVIKRLNCYLTNDSGPMHIAWSLYTPVTAIFGPTVPCLGFAPRGPSASIISVPLKCRPCSLHGGNTCPKLHFRCMRDIDTNLVWDDVSKKLFTKNISSTTLL